MELFLCVLLLPLVIASLYLCLSAVSKSYLYVKPIRINKSGKKRNFNLFNQLTKKIAKYIKLSDSKYQRLVTALAATGNNISPQEYETKNIIIAIGMFLLGLVSLVFSTWLFALCVICGILVYTYELKKLFSEQAKITEKFEEELPSLVAYIDQKISNDDFNVLKLLEEYRYTENDVFAQELQTTIADMRTSSYENALIMWSNRNSSKQLNLIVQGLLAVLRGEDQQFYFKMMLHDLDTQQKNNMKKVVNHLNDKLSPYMALLAISIISTILVPLVIDTITMLRQFFV